MQESKTPSIFVSGVGNDAVQTKCNDMANTFINKILDFNAKLLVDTEPVVDEEPQKTVQRVQSMISRHAKMSNEVLTHWLATWNSFCTDENVDMSGWVQHQALKDKVKMLEHDLKMVSGELKLVNVSYQELVDKSHNNLQNASLELSKIQKRMTVLAPNVNISILLKEAEKAQCDLYMATKESQIAMKSFQHLIAENDNEERYLNSLLSVIHTSEKKSKQKKRKIELEEETHLLDCFELQVPQEHQIPQEPRACPTFSICSDVSSSPSISTGLTQALQTLYFNLFASDLTYDSVKTNLTMLQHLQQLDTIFRVSYNTTSSKLKRSEDIIQEMQHSLETQPPRTVNAMCPRCYDAGTAEIVTYENFEQIPQELLDAGEYTYDQMKKQIFMLVSKCGIKTREAWHNPIRVLWQIIKQIAESAQNQRYENEGNCGIVHGEDMGLNSSLAAHGGAPLLGEDCFQLKTCKVSLEFKMQVFGFSPFVEVPATCHPTRDVVSALHRRKSSFSAEMLSSASFRERLFCLVGFGSEANQDDAAFQVVSFDTVVYNYQDLALELLKNSNMNNSSDVIQSCLANLPKCLMPSK